MGVGLPFDRRIYTKAGLMAAMEAFAQLASLRLADCDGCWEVDVQVPVGRDELTVALHFATYALSASLEERLL